MYSTRIIDETKRTIAIIVVPIFLLRQKLRQALFNRQDDVWNKRQNFLMIHLFNS